MTSITARPRAYVLAASIAVLAAACGNTAGSTPNDSTAAAGGDDVVAVVAGEPIRAADVEEALGHRLSKLEEQAYELRKQQLDEMIADKLLAAEAKRRGVTVDALLEEEVAAKVTPVTDADVDAFIAENRSRLPADPSALKPRIREFLAAQRGAERRAEYVESLRAAASVDVRLKRPRVYRAKVRDVGAPSRGPADAPVRLVEFSDFHCPYCRAVQPTLNALLAKYPNQVRLEYRHLPLDAIHPQARRVAEASWCADQQGRFWAFHDRVYASGPDGSDATLERLATEAKLDLKAFKECLASGRAQAPVQQDVEEAQRHGLTGTPGFLINGRLVSGNLPLEAFVEVIEEELKEAGSR
ncbi:MAG TPA: thioredoxin domain-containing protein [Vicinamibacterales bacterium]|nr:thioredoxin domain-containing protein [Vicinamibacterales bacterium]